MWSRHEGRALCPSTSKDHGSEYTNCCEALERTAPVLGTRKLKARLERMSPNASWPTASTVRHKMRRNIRHKRPQGPPVAASRGRTIQVCRSSTGIAEWSLTEYCAVQCNSLAGENACQIRGAGNRRHTVRHRDRCSGSGPAARTCRRWRVRRF